MVASLVNDIEAARDAGAHRSFLQDEYGVMFESTGEVSTQRAWELLTSGQIAEDNPLFPAMMAIITGELEGGE